MGCRKWLFVASPNLVMFLLDKTTDCIDFQALITFSWASNCPNKLVPWFQRSRDSKFLSKTVPFFQYVARSRVWNTKDLVLPHFQTLRREAKVFSFHLQSSLYLECIASTWIQTIGYLLHILGTDPFLHYYWKTLRIGFYKAKQLKNCQRGETDFHGQPITLTTSIKANNSTRIIVRKRKKRKIGRCKLRAVNCNYEWVSCHLFCSCH